MIDRITWGIASVALLSSVTACAGQQNKSELPPPSSAASEEYRDDSIPPPSSGIDTEVNFEDNEAVDETPRESEPPPTQTYSPASKLEDQ